MRRTGSEKIGLIGPPVENRSEGHGLFALGSQGLAPAPYCLRFLQAA